MRGEKETLRARRGGGRLRNEGACCYCQAGFWGSKVRSAFTSGQRDECWKTHSQSQMISEDWRPKQKEESEEMSWEVVTEQQMNNKNMFKFMQPDWTQVHILFWKLFPVRSDYDRKDATTSVTGDASRWKSKLFRKSFWWRHVALLLSPGRGDNIHSVFHPDTSASLWRPDAK